MTTVILDCYTDEPAGLGVPPYLGTYPRYLAGWLKSQGQEYIYLTIDDVRLWKNYGGKKIVPKKSQKTDIFTYNLTNNADNVHKILENCSEMYIICGVHVPGKYLSAMPGTLHEVSKLVQNLKCRKILMGPVVFGTSLHGGKESEIVDENKFEIGEYDFNFAEAKKYSVLGADILQCIPDIRVLEIETGKGCQRLKGCSFCTEPLKNKFVCRPNDDILEEMKALYDNGARYFRLGKQACIYAQPDLPALLKNIRKAMPEIKVLHIDNVNPVNVIGKNGEEYTKAIVEYCTEANVAAMGVESFDPTVVAENFLNTTPELTYRAIAIINKYGKERGPNGMPKFIPGINLIYGLKGETKETNAHNLKWLHKIIDDGFLLRRINIRQVAVMDNTPLKEMGGLKFLHKNKRYYWKWRNQVRQEIDVPMLEKITPVGTVLHDIYTEIYDGNTTFCRQFGTYPLIVGVKGRLPLKQFISIRVTGHMKRSIIGEAVLQN
ncbi:radical SAM protein [Candidatus Woesearchaeota archaeon]|nr:radical SAM protein [Candidatus Woesearchaeota archaeon]